MTLTFAYRALDGQGVLCDGIVEGESESLAVERIRGMGLRPVTIEAQREKLGSRKLALPISRKKVKPADLAVASRQLATMLAAGLSLLRSLTVLAEQTPSEVLRATLRTVRSDVEAGESLSNSFAKHPKAFSTFYVSMVTVGEAAGILDQVLAQLATSVERTVAVRRKVRSAMTYPVVVIAMVFVVIIAMLLFVVPVFADIYKDLDGTLPLPTRILVGVSSIMTTYFPHLIIGFGAMIWGLRRYVRTTRGRHAFDSLKLRLPIVGPILGKAALTRLASTLAVLIRAGVPILDAIDIVKVTVGNALFSDALADAQNGVRNGDSLAEPLRRHRVIPPMVAQMIAVGEETGAVDDLLTRVGEFYELEVETAVDALASVIEPVMIAVMGLVIGSMVLALYLPMFNVIKLVQ
ncbi:MAG: type II secretion system F family protein [Acidimicrobiales bacterium]